jgi:hypothetical protein
MIRKTIRLFRRRAVTWPGKDDQHIELVRRETWWLLILPVYSREEICSTNL